MSVTFTQISERLFEADIEDYEKYYYFFRSQTSFEEALTDLRECDAHSRGLFRGNYVPDTGVAVAQYGALAGAAGGVIAGLMMDAILGPAELRRKRRINMRRCMSFKGYARIGLDKEVWEEFNFEEGAREVAEADRQQMIVRQALVASRARPEVEELGL